MPAYEIDQAAWDLAATLEEGDRPRPLPEVARRRWPRQACRLAARSSFADEYWNELLDPQKVWVRNVSEGGIAFLHAGPLELPHVTFVMPGTETRTIFRVRVTRVRRIDDVFFDYGGKFVTRVRAPFHQGGRDPRSVAQRSLADEFLEAFDRGDDRPADRFARSGADDALLDLLVTTPPLIGSF